MEVLNCQVFFFKQLEFGVVDSTQPTKDDPWGLYLKFRIRKTSLPEHFIQNIYVQNTYLLNGKQAVLNSYTDFLVRLNTDDGVIPKSKEDFSFMAHITGIAISHARILFALNCAQLEGFSEKMIPIYSQDYLSEVIRVAIFRNNN